MDTRANKRQITDAVRRMYEIKTAKAQIEELKAIVYSVDTLPG